MPVMNGYEAAAIKKSGNGVPIIAMTANAMPEDIKRTRAAGMIEHIPKPIDLAKTIETLQAVLKN